jgi:hypothetical protein
LLFNIRIKAKTNGRNTNIKKGELKTICTGKISTKLPQKNNNKKDKSVN